MIKGYIKTGYDREPLFSEGMWKADVLKCTARFSLNEVDSADLTLPASNRPARSLLQKNAVIELKNDNEVVFIGDVATVQRNELGDIMLELDGALGWMRCVCKPPFTIKPTDPNGPVQNFLTAIFNQYNAGASTERQIQLGTVTVTGGVSMDHSSEYTTMLDLLREMREQLGGYLYVDYATGTPTVHYVATLTAKAAQALELGVNVLTVEDVLDFTDYASRVYATGTYYVTTTVDGKEKREQKPVDAGYVADTDAEALYGRTDLAYKSDTDMGGDKDNNIPDKTLAEAREIIRAEAQAILDERKVPLRSLDMTATELARIGVDHRLYKIATVAPTHVQILNIDTELVVRSVQRDYIDQGNSSVSFGREAATITGALLAVSSASGSSSGGEGQVGPPGPIGPQGPAGKDGTDGKDGEDGVSPSVTVTPITGGHRVTITDKSHPGGISFDVMDGSSSSDLKRTATIQKQNGVWQLVTSGMTMSWQDLWNYQADTITLITVDGTTIRHLHKLSVEFTSSSTISSVDVYFSNQRYNGRTAEGMAFKLTVPSDGSTGTITEIAGSSIPSSGGSSGGDHTDFDLNETTLQLFKRSDGSAATGSDVIDALEFGSVYIIGFKQIGSDEEFKHYMPLGDYAIQNGTETVRFYRPTDTGIDVISLEHNTSYATRDSITFDGMRSTQLFYINANTNVITDAEGNTKSSIGSDIQGPLTATGIWPILIEAQTLKIYQPWEISNNGLQDLTGIVFYRPTETGFEFVSIPAYGGNVATRRTVEFGGDDSGDGFYTVLASYSNGGFTFDKTGEEIVAAIMTGKIPIVRHNASVVGQDYFDQTAWMYSHASYDGEDTYLHFYCLNAQGDVSRMSYYISEAKAYVSTSKTVPAPTSADNGKTIRVVNGAYNLREAKHTFFYNVNTQNYDLDYSQITSLLQAGVEVECKIICGNSEFMAPLTRHRAGSQTGDDFYAFDVSTYQWEDGAMWWVSVRAYDTTPTQATYYEGTIATGQM